MSTFETLKGMIVKQMKVNPDTVTESSRLVEDLKADSANVMVMIMDVEDTFGITVEDDQIMKLKTVGDVVKYIDATSKLSANYGTRSLLRRRRRLCVVAKNGGCLHDAAVFVGTGVSVQESGAAPAGADASVDGARG